MSGFLSTDQYVRKQWWGYTDLGPNQIPPQPFYTVLTDRADGVTLWYLTFDPAISYPDNLGTITINTSVPGSPFRDLGYGKTPVYSKSEPPVGAVYAAFEQIYAPYNEPYIENMPQGYAARLCVRSGVLQADISAVNDPRFSKLDTAAQANGPMLLALPQNGLVGFNQAFRRIIWSDNTRITDPAFVGWIPWTVTQTPNPANVNSMANLSNPKADV